MPIHVEPAVVCILNTNTCVAAPNLTLSCTCEKVEVWNAVPVIDSSAEVSALISMGGHFYKKLGGQTGLKMSRESRKSEM
jgi:hypothetical protein